MTQSKEAIEDYLSLKYPISIYPEEARELWIETVYQSGKREIPLPSKRIYNS